MKVVVAESAGFCAGVKNAMRTAIDAAETHQGVYSLGSIIHNNQAVRLLELRGVTTLSADTTPPGDRPVLIRAHGLHPAGRQSLLDAGCTIVDATCVYVAANQRLAAQAAADGYTVVVAGDPGHPEVTALLGSAGATARVIATPDEAESLSIDGKIFLLAQTTFEPDVFTAIAERLRQFHPELVVRNTICSATHQRQAEVRQLAGVVDALVVVGGKHSANTRRLAEVGQNAGKKVFLVETASEIQPADFASFACVGVTAGASTPAWITQAVVDRLSDLGRNSLTSKSRRMLRILLESRLLTAISAVGLSIAVQALAGLLPDWLLALAAGCYVFFAHIINRRVPDNPELRDFSGIDPFYNRNRIFLLVCAWAAAFLALALAWRTGNLVIFFIAIFAALAHSRLAVERISLIARLRQVPGARILTTSIGWTLAVSGPVLVRRFELFPCGAVAGLGFTFFLVAGKILIRDLYDQENDHLMGIGTLPVRWGIAKTVSYARSALTIAALVPLAAAGVMVVFSTAGIGWCVYVFLLALLPVCAGELLKRAVNRRTDPVYLLCSLEGLGIMAGVLGVIAGMFL